LTISANVKLFWRNQVIATWSMEGGVDGNWALYTSADTNPYFSLFGASDTAFNQSISHLIFWGKSALTDAQMIAQIASASSTHFSKLIFT
jgi:hypothetical protein